jgi:hypothetical protein
MNVKAKFKVESVTHYQQSGEVFLKVVTGGSKENDQFWKYTPAGEIRLHIDNPAAMAVFKPGLEFYAILEPAVDAVAAANAPAEG